MNRAGASAVVVHAVKGLEPRAPELEIPRPLGAGVGVCFLDFQLCSECGAKLVEHSGFLVCSACGLAATPVYEPSTSAELGQYAPLLRDLLAYGYAAVERDVVRLTEKGLFSLLQKMGGG